MIGSVELTDEETEVMTLLVGEELTYGEVSEEMGISPSSVRQAELRAKLKLEIATATTEKLESLYG